MHVKVATLAICMSAAYLLNNTHIQFSLLLFFTFSNFVWL